MATVLTECQSKKDQLKKTLEAIQDRLKSLSQEIEEYREI